MSERIRWGFVGASTIAREFMVRAVAEQPDGVLHGIFSTSAERRQAFIDDYGDSDDGSYDGVTEQWFASMDEYRAHIAEKDFADVWADLGNFLDVDRLSFVLTEEPVVILDGPTS